MTEHPNDPSGQQPSPGDQPSHGQQQPPYGDPSSYGQQQPSYGDPSSYGQQPAYGQPQAYGQPAYGQQPHYAAAPYGQQAPYGGYGQPAPGSRPARPGGVVTSAVFGFIFGAFGVIATIVLIFIGAAAGGASGDLEDAVPGLGSFAGAAAGILIVFGILALAWTAVMIWGSIWALTGRSRVLLIVGGSISIATTGFSFFGSLSDVDTNGAGGVIVGLVLFVMAILIVVLLSNRAAAAFFGAHRALRGR